MQGVELLLGLVHGQALSQYLTWYLVLYLGWTLDFMPTVWSSMRPSEESGLEAARLKLAQ